MIIEKALSHLLRSCTCSTKVASLSKLCEAPFEISFCACETLGSGFTAQEKLLTSYRLY